MKHITILDDNKTIAIISFLKNLISSQELGKALGLSHQASIQLTARMCRQWFSEGKMAFVKQIGGNQ